ncbi:hypothetical protein C0992_011463, partial [Termitomyces sp. T32_za158]
GRKHSFRNVFHAYAYLFISVCQVDLRPVLSLCDILANDFLIRKWRHIFDGIVIALLRIQSSPQCPIFLGNAQ